MSELQAVNVTLDDTPKAPFALPRSTPEACGIASTSITAFLEAADGKRLGLHSFMLLRHGRVAAEAWWSPYKPESPHQLYSLSKSFTSTAIGLAVAEGRLSVEDRVLSFFPDRQASDRPYLDELTVKHLLTMTTGHERNALENIGREEDWVGLILNEPIVHPPGTVFVYNNGTTYLLSAIMQQVTGQSVHAYLQPRLYEPLGIEGTWAACPRGVSIGAWGLNLPTEAIAKFGQLYLQRGRWEGKQLIPEAWVDEATAFHVPTDNREKPDSMQGYGYQFWRSRHNSYRGAGAYGQYCLVLPEQQAVVAITAEAPVMHLILDEVWTHLLPGMGDEVLPADDSAYAELQQAAAALAYPPFASLTESVAAEEVSGHRYALENNQAGIQAVEWRFEGDTCLVRAWTGGGEIEFQCGLGYWIEGRLRLRGKPSPMAASGGWQKPDTFKMGWRMLEVVSAQTFTCVFTEDRVEITAEFGRPEPHLLTGKRVEHL